MCCKVGLIAGAADMHDAVEDEVSRLQRFCICIVEFLSGQAIDPHLYFQQKMTGEIAQAGSIDELIELMRHLIDWVDTMAFRPDQGDRLDAKLLKQGFPPLSIIRITDNENVVTKLIENN